MKKFIFLSLIAMIMAGCLEVEEDYYINPDGSGKLITKTVIFEDTAGMMGSQYNVKSSEELAKKIAQEMLSQYKTGTDTDSDDYLYISDMEYGQADTGTYYVNATIYFSDVNLTLENNDIQVFSAGENSEGQFILAVVNDTTEERELKEEKDQADIDEEKLKLKAEQIKAQLNTSKTSAEMYLKSFKSSSKYHFAGNIVSYDGFDLTDNTLSLNLTGKEILGNIDKLVNDDSKLMQLAASETSSPYEDTAIMSELMFGKSTIQFTGEKDDSKPAFDFSEEIEKAKIAHEGYMKELELDSANLSDTTTEIKTANMPEIKNVGLVAISAINKPYRKEEKQNDHFYNISSYDMDEPGIRLTLCIELTNEIADTGLTKFEQIIDDKGNILSVIDSYNTPSASKDRKNILVSQKFKGLPSEDAAYFKNIKGTITCQAMNEPRMVELGEISVIENAKSENGTLSIESLYEGGYGDNGSMQLKINYDKAKIIDIQIFDTLGTEINCSYQKMYGHNNIYSTYINFEQNYPDTLLVKAVVVDGTKEIELPFETGPVDFNGNPVEVEQKEPQSKDSE
ncbi:MAG: hypothetical protein ACIAQZ_13840 [Sedimentisphaeraceae bacterium JB056]